MEAVVGLLLVLMGVSHGVETSCDGRQDGGQCVGALGGAVNIQLMDDASEIQRFEWKKGDSVLVQWIRKTIIVKSEENKSLFIPSNGTVRINNLNRADSGEYKLLIFDSNGRRTGNRTLQLSLQAPVSSVQLVSECLSQGQKKVSCSSEGDGPQYSWTLDGHTLTDSELLSGINQTNVIILRQNISGRLVCSVRNQVSQSSREEIISTCGFIFINCTSNGTLISEWVFRENNTLCVEPTSVPTTVTHSTVGKETELNYSSTINSSSNQNEPRDLLWYFKQWPVMVGVLSVLLFLLVVGVVMIYGQKKKQKPKAEENEQELTYADVRFVQQQRRQVEQRVEEGVEYGQVKFSKKPHQPEPAGDNSLYAQVRKGR